MTLEKIISDGKLVAGSCGYICFTEAPITMLPKMVEYFASYKKRAKFAPYGIGFPKSLLFIKGARPVIYSNYGEKDLLAPSIQWRHEDYHPVLYKKSGYPKYRDYTWMREWRLPLKEFSFDEKHCFIVTKESWEDICFQHLEPMNGPNDIPEWKRLYKHISFQEISDGDILTKLELINKLSEQELGELIE